MRFFFRGLGLALPVLMVHVACGGDSSSPANPTSTDAGADAPIDPTDPDAAIEPPPPDTKVVNFTNETLTVNGATRKYLLGVPVKYDATKRYPLVLSFHGDGGTGSSMQKSWPLEAATGEDAIVAYPDGLGRAWNIYDVTEQNDDMAYVRALIPALAGKYNIDTGRVLGFGYSKGGFFVNQLSCRFGGIFKAISVHAGGAPYEQNGPNQNQNDNDGYQKCDGTPTAAFVFHGTSDGEVTLDSGDYDAKWWAHKNGCDPESREDLDPSPCKRHKNCPAGKPATFCAIPGLGHGVWDRGVEVTWTYFQALP